MLSSSSRSKARVCILGASKQSKHCTVLTKNIGDVFAVVSPERITALKGAVLSAVVLQLRLLLLLLSTTRQAKKNKYKQTVSQSVTAL